MSQQDIWIIVTWVIEKKALTMLEYTANIEDKDRRAYELDPVDSTVRYEMMKLCTGSVQDTMRRQQLVIDDTRSVEGIYAFIYCTKWSSGQMLPMPYGLID